MEIKTILQHFRRRAATPTAQSGPTAEDRLVEAYDRFAELSVAGEIESVVFSGAKAILNFRDGRRYYFDPRDRVASMYTVPTSGNFEAKETAFLQKAVRSGDVCFDVGASFGWYAVLLSRLVGTAGHVYSFEPIPPTFAILKENLALNNCTNVTAESCALADHAGEQTLFVPDIGVSGSLRLHPFEKEYTEVLSPVETIDGFCRQHGIEQVDFIKADIEGAELQLLQGGGTIIDRCKPVLFLEVQRNSTELFGYQPAEVFAWLAERGYSSWVVSAACELLRVEDYSEPLPDYNFIFLPENWKGCPA